MFDDNHVSMNQLGNFSHIAYLLQDKMKKHAAQALKRVGTLPVSGINYELKKNYLGAGDGLSLGEDSEFNVKQT